MPSLGSVAPALAVDRSDGKVTVTVKPLGTPQPTRRKSGRADSHPATVRDKPYSLLLLVVRITHGPVGPIGMDLDKTEPFDLEVAPSLAEHLATGVRSASAVVEAIGGPIRCLIGSDAKDVQWWEVPTTIRWGASCG